MRIHSLHPIGTSIKCLLSVFLVFIFQLAISQHSQPKIGLTLSGGGAKGLAHIGILKAIDSAGLKIDYVTGTSMGSVIGSLYAIGYSGKEIEKIGRTTDWSAILSNQISLRSISMEEKGQYGRFAIELPLQRRKLNLPTGALESQELWIKLSELYFPAYKIKEFDKLKIPFTGIASDISNGEAVVLDSGELVTAIRASMAIPGVFTTVERNGRSLVDGGVTRNFPVSDALRMGANYVIGSNVAQGFLPKEKLTNPIQILLQIAFTKEKVENKIQVALTDIYINQPLEKYTMANFDKADEIIDSGINEGNKYYHQFKKLADSIATIKGYSYNKQHSSQLEDSVYITEHRVKGLVRIKEAAFLHSLHYDEYSYYTAKKISEMIRRGYGTRDYNFIHYRLDTLGDGSAMITFEVDESEQVINKVGLHYNTYTGVSLLSNLTARNYFTPNSRSYLTVNFGENFRIKTEHLQYFGRQKNFEVIPSVQYEKIKFNTYNSFKKSGVYQQRYFVSDIKMQIANQRIVTGGLGTRFESEKYIPDLASSIELIEKNRYFTTYAYGRLNSLDKPVYPNKGIKVFAEIGWVFDQHPIIIYKTTGVNLITPELSLTNAENYAKTELNVEFYKTINPEFVFFVHSKTGINFTNSTNKFNTHFIGGLNNMYRNQIPFAGLQDVQANAQSVSATMLGLRYKLDNNLYLMGKVNGLVNNFIQNQINDNPKWMSGAVLTLAFNSLLGPIEFSTMYSPQVRQLQAYINFGFSF